MAMTVILAEDFMLSFLDLRGYRLFAHISVTLSGFMFAQRANRGTMRKSYFRFFLEFLCLLHNLALLTS